MAWKGVHISRPAQLSLADGQLVVAQEDGEVRLPLEDIAYVVMDSLRGTVTATLLSACMEAGIALIITDERHTPNGILLPFHMHHRQAGIAAMQLALGEPFKKRAWQAIVGAKITNQATHLKYAGAEPSALLAMAKLVRSGDPDNVEARAAREYWARLFSDFVRDNPADLRNKLMNYGYAVVRAGVARALVSLGLLPCVGLHHCSVTNAFNLADDLVEPFRPFVDRIAAQRAAGRESADVLTVDDRRAMAGVLMQDASFAKQKLSLLTATEKTASSLVQAMEIEKASALQLPEFTLV